MGKPGAVPHAHLVGENVEQTAVDYGSESLVPIPKRHRVFHLEFDGQATLGRLAASHADGFVDEIDAGDLVSAGRQEERVLARAAAGIENRADDQIDRFGDGPLRPADVPGRLAAIGGFESAAISQGAHAGFPLSPFNRAVPPLLTNAVCPLGICCCVVRTANSIACCAGMRMAPVADSPVPESPFGPNFSSPTIPSD